MDSTSPLPTEQRPRTGLQSFFKDARHFQIFYLGGFLIFGLLALDWQVNLAGYLVLLGTGLGVQAIGIKLTGKSWNSLKSALITCLGLCLLLKANSLWTLSFTAAVAIGSKFLIRSKGKHIFNPANFGIILAILLTGDAWVSPGQWGNHIILLFMMGAAGLIVLLKVGRLDTSLSFLLSFGALLFCEQILYKGWPLDHFFHTLTSGTLLLFTFFMITDPVTTPNAPKARIIWGIAVGTLTYILTLWFYVFDAPIWALIIISPLTVWLDRHFPYQRFQWLTSSPKLQHT
ncbi:MAG: RnfABCDGE type electron transport complex subunit D [Bacteroidota bacterium]